MDEMKQRFTSDEKLQIKRYRDRYWQQAISTEPADRPRAEAAAKRLAEIASIKISDIQWAENPYEGRREYNTSSDLLRDLLRDSLSASLRVSLRVSLWDLLRGSLPGSLSASLRRSLRDSLWVSLSDSLNDSLRVSLRDSLWASLWDAGWLCMYSYAVEVLGLECSEVHRELLGLRNEIAASCFALWIKPGTIILCERPSAVEVRDGRLVGLTF
jgi:hypothetical protein